MLCGADWKTIRRGKRKRAMGAGEEEEEAERRKFDLGTGDLTGEPGGNGQESVTQPAGLPESVCSHSQ